MTALFGSGYASILKRSDELGSTLGIRIARRLLNLSDCEVGLSLYALSQVRRDKDRAAVDAYDIILLMLDIVLFCSNFAWYAKVKSTVPCLFCYRTYISGICVAWPLQDRPALPLKRDSDVPYCKSLDAGSSAYLM